MAWLSILMLVVAAVAALALGNEGTLAGANGYVIASVAASLALLFYFAGGIASEYGGRWLSAGRDLMIWAGLGLALVLGYSFRDDLAPIYYRVAGELAPPGTGINVGTSDREERAVRIRKRPDGHFAVRSEVNGRLVTMLVDTGASKVVLTSRDAAAAGLDVAGMSFTIPVQTANGTGFAAAVRLDSISVGGIRRQGLDALVAKPNALGESLLGMNYLRDLRSYEFSGDFLTFRG
ncbi:MAG: TIGR02281 family clan AA aspartic protease [Pseudomonadota bacterium]